MTQRRILGGLACLFSVLLVATVVASSGKQQIVTTRDGKTFEGEVTVKGEVVTIVTKVGTVRLNRANVQRIEDAAGVEEQFRNQLAELEDKDAEGRVELARWALDRRQFDLALDALDAAIAIDPNNEEAIQLRRSVLKQRRLQRSTTTAPGAAAGKPGTSPRRPGAQPPAGAERQPAEPAEDADSPEPQRRADELRMVTAEEINRIRQLELQKGENVQIRLQKNVRQRYLASSEFTPQQFNKLSPQEQGYEILTNGASRLHNDVVIATDPASLAQFRNQVQRTVLSGCAAAACHGGSTAGDFTLHNPANRDAETYTNFILMQSYRKTIDGREYRMIDRARPENSLALLYGLPRQDSPLPHPEAQNFKPVFKGRNDPKYQQFVDWAGRTLAPIPPEYGIDLSKPPEEGDGSTTRPTARGQRQDEE